MQNVARPDPLFPPIEAYAQHRLDADDGHVLYAEECGDPGGLPAVFLHGGPGAGCGPTHRRFTNRKFNRLCKPRAASGREASEGQRAGQRGTASGANISEVSERASVGSGKRLQGVFAQTVRNLHLASRGPVHRKEADIGKTFIDQLPIVTLGEDRVTDERVGASSEASRNPPSGVPNRRASPGWRRCMLPSQERKLLIINHASSSGAPFRPG